MILCIDNFHTKLQSPLLVTKMVVTAMLVSRFEAFLFVNVLCSLVFQSIYFVAQHVI